MFPLPDDKMIMNHEQEDVSEWVMVIMFQL